MFLITEPSKNEIVLSVNGLLNIQVEKHFTEKLAELAAGPHKTITVDLLETKSINSSCIAALVSWALSLSDLIRSE